MTTSTTRILVSLGMIILLALAVWSWLARPSPAPPAAASTLPTPLSGATLHTTAHYRISSTATAGQTAQVGVAVEALHAAYMRHFGLAPRAQALPLHLVLYRDRAQFKAHNTSQPWAEAFYRRPACHAYVADGANPYHWMLHEATHQLGTEVAGLGRRRWVDEGLASYFGASRLEHGVLRPGTLDPDAYPIWWLADVRLGTDAAQDVREGTLIALRALITDTGPDISRHVNQYYVHYWSLTHFLFHYDGGRYGPAYRALIAEGGTLEGFERRIGPVARVEREWHAWLRALSEQQRTHTTPDDWTPAAAVER